MKARIIEPYFERSIIEMTDVLKIDYDFSNYCNTQGWKRKREADSVHAITILILYSSIQNAVPFIGDGELL